MRRLIVVAALLTLLGCEGCPPDGSHFMACVATCGSVGVHQVTYSKCICNERKPETAR